MSTHIGAEMGDYADTVLLPGDPLRAKYIAENFLTNVKQVNSVRNAFGYTGEYKGHRISVQGSGMGIPSMSIYINELVKFFGVKTIIRVGSCGGMAPDVHLRDVLLASGSTTDSAVTANTFGAGIHYAPLANFELLDAAYHEAQKLGITPKVGDIFAADRFYNDELDMKKLADYGVIGTEMESAGLYLLGAKLHFRALSILTVSDLIFGEEKTTAEEREKTFNDMINISLDTAIAGK
ncbi:purine-nucleoside phosphorylase [Furfurilactobacillus siliginis]|uniref:Purine nucleoside phosphorylase DeoD-type n=1 Tax=Furfurilactobacillus siliginis TaxID=348151 RepID=A0A0R2LCS1_9LACO|nr:purine-nucleoside phosphorylase [Furfurilactobacillus siliginis]KRN96164.1 purine nucleoside phosphorylase [Furfurilactobacillus siliginis]GEK27911.1 purine nucleoside phosphorylase DeoD-type [Furfurilactobacillus siliginis]